MEAVCAGQRQVLAEIEKVAPGVPLLALGQTVFWDEPLKSGVILRSRALGFRHRLVAGIHDTDYFAKLPGSRGNSGKFVAMPHNDTTTRDLWSAAGEFSALFGSETIVTRDRLQRSGVKVARISADRPKLLDEATEAFRWRGIVAHGDESWVAADLPLPKLFPVLYETLKWAVEETLECIPTARRKEATEAADRLLAIACDQADIEAHQSLADYYERLLGEAYEFVAGEHVELETTRTSRLLRFNCETAGLPRFRIADTFLRPVTSEHALRAYDEAIEGSEIYPLHRLGTGAIPFDLVVPGHGRGTLRIGSRGIVVMTPKPLFASLKRPITSIHDLAEVVEKKWGRECALIGKAVTLIGMLATEFVFVFHHGASGYVRFSKRLHRRLRELDDDLHFHPILRVRYSAWDALHDTNVWLRLPDPLRDTFGTEELCSSSFSARWKLVAAEQRELINTLATLRRPFDLIQFFQSRFGQAWSTSAEEYTQLRKALDSLNERIRSIKSKKADIANKQRALRKERQELEIKKGQHWRAKIFEKKPSEADFAEREALIAQIGDVTKRLDELKSAWRHLQAEQDAFVQHESVRKAHERRRDIELEAELHRLRLVRSAVIASDGLELAGRRPAAWWFPIVCPDGEWFRCTVENADYCLEDLNS